MHRVRFLVVLLSTLLLIAGGVRAAQAQDNEPRVHAVLFFSPTCGHCHKVMTEDLPPLVDAYGNKLLILAIDVSQDNGRQLYLSAIEQFGVPPDRMAVPMLIVGDRVLVGSGEIPAEFPQLIQVGLAMGGTPWPEIPRTGRDYRLLAAGGNGSSHHQSGYPHSPASAPHANADASTWFADRHNRVCS